MYLRKEYKKKKKKEKKKGTNHSWAPEPIISKGLPHKLTKYKVVKKLSISFVFCSQLGKHIF